MEGTDVLLHQVKTEKEEEYECMMNESEPPLQSQIKAEEEEEYLSPVKLEDNDEDVQSQIKTENDDDDTSGQKSQLLPQIKPEKEYDLLSDEPQSERQQRACRRQQTRIKFEEEETDDDKTSDEEQPSSWDEVEEDNNSCNICEKEFSTKKQLDRHVKTHRKTSTKNQVKSSDKPVHCDLCDFTCARKRNLFVHTQREHADKKKSFKCSFKDCAHVSRTKQQLKRHILTHVGPKNLVCPTCGYTCVLTNDLVVHIRRHEGLKPFKCSFLDCAYASAHIGHVKRHEKIHLRNTDNTSCIVEFSCAICDYSTDQRTNLKRHLVTKHSNKRPFKCPNCNYTAKTQDMLAHHLRSYPEHRVKSSEPKQATDLQLSRKPAWRRDDKVEVKKECR